MLRHLATRLAAQEAERKQQWQEASRLWDSVAASSRATVWDRIGAIRAAAFAGRLQHATGLLAVLDAPAEADASVAMVRAEIAERQGPPQAAVDYWRHAATLQSDPYWALFGLARNLHRLEKNDEARQAMGDALALASAERAGAQFAAYLDMRDGEFGKADKTLRAFGFSDDERATAILTWLPGMTTSQERKVMREAALGLTGCGHAVDLGCWLGSLTVAMALGFETKLRAATPYRIHAYDHFLWEARYMDEVWSAKFSGPPPRDGETFLPAFESITRPWAPLIEVHQEDLMRVKWINEPIELLSIDAMKWPEVTQKIIAAFYPSLIPQRSLVFHQDFCHKHTWWIHIHQFLLRSHFELVKPVDGSEGVLFRVTRPFSERDLAAVLSADLSDQKLADDAFAFSRHQVLPEDRAKVHAARIECERANGRVERAEAMHASSP